MTAKKKQNEQANLEKERILNPDRVLAKKKKRRKHAAVLIVGTILALAGCVIGGIQIVRAMGRNRLITAAETAQPDLQESFGEKVPEEGQENEWKAGWIKYRDAIYEYNDDIMTFLFMGIDKRGDVREVAEGTNGGQADALFLAVVNPRDKTIKIIGINRNTMADVDFYNETGAYVTTAKAQLAIQHGFGNGMEESCEYQKKAVQKLFYNLPVHGYAAVNMSAISTINDAVGGVDVTVLEDMSRVDKSLVEGQEVHLMGGTAFHYIHDRDVNRFGSADKRLDRQKQYLKAFIQTAATAAKKDLSVVLDLYQAVMPQMVTDISLDEVAYLAPELVDYHFGEDSFYTLGGETVMGETFEEFYPDEEALCEMILEIFYEKVE
ncbi:MAG: LCP family protein [Lachnospiraceae bacterium]|nr:LCP family protein [Lachnospiraceae bacterium]